jgi:transcriptional regulator with XRE-family HTH domain
MPTAAALLRQARARAGLSQRALARRAGTAQSVIARIERGQSSPTVATLERLLAAAGSELRAGMVVRESSTVPERSHMLDDVPRILRLTPEQRLEELKNFSRFLYEARRG